MKFSSRKSGFNYWSLMHAHSRVILGLMMVSVNANGEHSFSADLIVDASYFDVESSDTNSVTRGLLGVGYEFNSENWTAAINALAHRGDNASDYIGDVQAFSNIDEEDFQKVFEAWIGYRTNDQRYGIKAGWVDLNTEFAFADNAGEFLNSSMGFSPTVFPLPTYPDPAASVVVTNTYSELNEFGIAISAGADGNSFSDRFYIGEWRYSQETFTFKFGGWYHDGEFDRLDGSEISDGSGGIYALIDGQISKTDLGYYVQFGSSDPLIAEIQRHFGAGVVQYKTFGNDAIVTGVGVTTVWLSEKLQSEHRTEDVFEVFVKYEFNEHFSIKPNMQYIVNPAGEDRNEWVATLRLELSM